MAAGLISGYAVAAATGVRPLGGVVLLIAGGVAAWAWKARDGWSTAIGLGLVYAGAFAASHPLAPLIGTWPAVLSVSAIAALSAYLVSDRRAKWSQKAPAATVVRPVLPPFSKDSKAPGMRSNPSKTV